MTVTKQSTDLTMYNQWRSLSMRMLGESLQNDAANPQLSRDIVYATSHATDEIARDILATIGHVMLPAPDLNRANLQRIIGRAIELGRNFRAQRAVYVFDNYEPLSQGPIMYDESTMDEVQDNEDDVTMPRRVILVKWPCVVKHGNENGEDVCCTQDSCLDTSLLIHSSRLICKTSYSEQKWSARKLVEHRRKSLTSCFDGEDEESKNWQDSTSKH